MYVLHFLTSACCMISFSARSGKYAVLKCLPQNTEIRIVHRRDGIFPRINLLHQL